MRTANLALCLSVLLSCGNPMDGQPGAGGAGGADGKDGQPGAMGSQGPAGPAGRDAVTGGSRLQPLYWKGADGTRWAAGWFWDKDRRERCTLQLVTRGPGNELATGLWVCAPPEIGQLTEQAAARYVRMTLEE